MVGRSPFGCPSTVAESHSCLSDPLFMMHHAVRQSFSVSGYRRAQTHTRYSPQMVDKVWYDWQNAKPENFRSFGGGSVSAHSQPGLYAQFPAGGPPFLNVSNNSDRSTRVVADSSAF